MSSHADSLTAFAVSGHVLQPHEPLPPNAGGSIFMLYFCCINNKLPIFSFKALHSLFCLCLPFTKEKAVLLLEPPRLSELHQCDLYLPQAFRFNKGTHILSPKVSIKWKHFHSPESNLCFTSRKQEWSPWPEAFLWWPEWFRRSAGPLAVGERDKKRQMNLHVPASLTGREMSSWPPINPVQGSKRHPSVL